MRKTILILLTLVCWQTGFAQNPTLVKARKELKEHPQEDTFHINRLLIIARNEETSLNESDTILQKTLDLSRNLNYQAGEFYSIRGMSTMNTLRGNRAEGLRLGKQALALAEKMGDKKLQARALTSIGYSKKGTKENKDALADILRAEALAREAGDPQFISITQSTVAMFYANSLSDLPRAMEWLFKSLANAETAKCKPCMSETWVNMASIYTQLKDDENSLAYYLKGIEGYKEIGDTLAAKSLLVNVGERYRILGKNEEAMAAYKEGLLYVRTDFSRELIESNIADVYVRTGPLDSAFYYGFKSLNEALRLSDLEGVSWVRGVLSRAYLKAGNADSALYQARLGLAVGMETGTLEFIRDNYSALAKAFEAKGRYDSAYKYQDLYIAHRDSMNNSQVTNHNNLLQYNYNLQKKETEIVSLNQKQKLQNYMLIAAAAVLGLIILSGVLLIRNNRQRKRAYDLLSHQKSIIEQQRDQTNKALADLQLAQSQLLQSEKMASLGELTAGIAHEIQNPLNFVNNFSDLNKELLTEMKEEIAKSNMAEVIAIANDVYSNEEKISHHGKRADSIVKGMLQHSRKSNATKEPVKINDLADEYLRLAYHGLRAKEKTFNATLNTSYDPLIDTINIVPQDMGRVILNLITNAFYSVGEKKKAIDQQVAEGKAIIESYEPTVSVSTKRKGNMVEIVVADNGFGIPQAIADKIFQPFFTTKPTGQGTGLGLSMSYDIVTKSHDGELKVIPGENRGATFIIILPI